MPEIGQDLSQHSIEELCKIDTGTIWKQRIFWMLGGYFLINCFLMLVYIAQSAYQIWIKWGTIRIFEEGYYLPIIPAVLGILLICLLYFGLTKKSSTFGGPDQLAQWGKLRKVTSIFLLLTTVLMTLVGPKLIGDIVETFLLRSASSQVALRKMTVQILIGNNVLNAVFKLLLTIIFVRLSVWIYFAKKERFLTARTAAGSKDQDQAES